MNISTPHDGEYAEQHASVHSVPAIPSAKQQAALNRHQTSRAVHKAATGDHGHRGAHTHDHVMHLNGHPHAHGPIAQDGPDAKIDTRRPDNHGFSAIHVRHDARDRRAEHHPPAGLMVHHATEGQHFGY